MARRPLSASARSSIALITAPDLKTARALARAALQARLAACVNLVPKIESHYWWQGKIESGKEVLLICKTIQAKLNALEALIVCKHPYDTPEFIVVEITRGNRRYLEWLRSSTATVVTAAIASRSKSAAAPSLKR